MRLFVALILSDEMKKSVSDFEKKMKQAGVTGRYVPSEKMHITLAFIGERKDPEKVADVLSGVRFSPFDMTLSGKGNFGEIIWLGTQKCEELDDLSYNIRKALRDNDIQYDTKKFNPHITVIRKSVFNEPVSHDDIQPEPVTMHIDSFSLMKSEPGRDGMVYTEIKKFRCR